MYLEGIEKKAHQMTLIYKVIHKIVIRYGIFFLVIIGALYWSNTIINTETNVISLNDDTSAQKGLQIKTFKSGIDKIQGTGNLMVFVGLGTFEQSGSLLSSYNNLISYNGYTLTRYFEGDTSIFAEKDLLEGTVDTKEELESFMTNLRSIENKDKILKRQYTPIPIKENIIATFNLQCLSQSKIYNGLCEIFTDNFVETFMLYDIKQDIGGFKDILTRLINNDRTKYQNKMCDNLIYYAYYSENTSTELRSLMKLCPANNYDTFNKFALYSEIQKELENKIISNTVYADNIINEYKLRSFLQILYEELNNKKINIERINVYLDFVEQLLKQEKISNLDTNIVYYFNNYNLKIQIQNPELFMKVENKTELNTLLKRINNINNGNLLIGYKGLNYKVSENILIRQTEVENGIIEQNYTSIIAKLLDQINNFEVDEKQISGNQVLAKGILHLPPLDKKSVGMNLKIKTRFQEQSSVLYIKKIDIDGEIEFNKNINAIIGSQQRSFGDFQKYISENRSLLSTKEDINNGGEAIEKSFCENAQIELSTIAFMERCNSTALGVSFKVNETKVGISLNYENYIFKNIDVSDSASKEKITEYVNRSDVITRYRSIDEKNMVKFLIELVSVLKDVGGKGIGTGDIDFNASENTIIVIESIKKYLGITVSDIVEKEGKIAITFTLANINLIGNYNIKTHTIEQLYFKDIKIDGVPAIIKSTQILLEDSNIEEIKKFRKDPISYFNSKNIENQLLYLKYGPK